MPVVTGRHLREWCCHQNSVSYLATRAEAVWSGSNLAASKKNQKLKLYRCSWENPHPEKTIATIAFERGSLELPHPFCLAITCDDDPTPLPPEPGLLFAMIGMWTGRGRCSVTIEDFDGPPIKGTGSHNRLLPAGRHKIEVRDGETLLRRGCVTVQPGSVAYMYIDAAQTLFPLPESQPNPMSELIGQVWCIFDLALSRDGRTLATAAGDGTVVVWKQDGDSWTQASLLPAQDLPVRAVCFSPNDDILAVAGNDGSLRLWRISRIHDPITLRREGDAIHAIAFSPDGRILASGNANGGVDVWNVATHEKTHSFKAGAGAVGELAFSPDGALLGTASSGENAVNLWDVASWTLMQRMMRHTSPVTAISFSPDGTKIASGGQDSMVILWDVRTGRALRSLPHAQSLSALAFAPDGTKLAAGGEFQTIRVWDLASYKAMNDFHAHWAEVRSLVFAPDGKTLITAGSDNYTRVWSVADLPAPFDAESEWPSPRATFSVHKDWAVWSAFSSAPNDLVAAVGVVPFDLKIWSLKDFSQVSEFKVSQDDGDWMLQQSMAFIPGGKNLVTCVSRKGKPQIAVWEPGKRIQPHRFEPQWIGESNGSSLSGMAMSADGAGIAVFSRGAALVSLIDIRSRAPRWCAPSEQAEPSSISFASGDSLVVVGTKRGLVAILDAATGEKVHEPLRHGTENVDALAASSKDVLATAGQDCTVKLWNLETFQCDELPREHCEWIRSAAFSPDGAMLATAGGASVSEPTPAPHKGEVCLWDVEQRKLLVKFHTHYGCVTSAVFSPDGNSIATTGRDGKMHLWDVEELLKHGVDSKSSAKRKPSSGKGTE